MMVTATQAESDEKKYFTIPCSKSQMAKINGQDMPVIVDTGADVSCISQKQSMAMKGKMDRWNGHIWGIDGTKKTLGT